MLITSVGGVLEFPLARALGTISANSEPAIPSVILSVNLLLLQYYNKPVNK